MKILAIMQCQWFHNPERVKSGIEYVRQQYGDEKAERHRRRIIAYALFAGCKSGRVLRQVFGQDLCERIVWEEASRELGGVASAKFPADIPHLVNVIRAETPAVVIAFGRIAADGVTRALRVVPEPQPSLILAPHPAARHPKTLEQLREAKNTLDAYLAMEASP